MTDNKKFKLYRLYYRWLKNLFGIRFCNGCGKCIWWNKETLRFIESPKDEYGYSAPACSSCIAYSEENY